VVEVGPGESLLGVAEDHQLSVRVVTERLDRHACRMGRVFPENQRPRLRPGLGEVRQAGLAVAACCWAA
jgi:hypothetical protein